MFKRVICFALSIVMMCGMALTTFAAETDAVEENPDADAFFAFVTGPERMDDDGDFTFSFNSILTSESRFTPNNQNLDVWVQVWLRDIDETPTWTDPWFPPKDETKTISISLYKVGEVGEAATLVGSFSACANDKKTTHTFSNLDTTSEYFLEFEKETSLGARMRYDGKGNVSDVTVTVN